MIHRRRPALVAGILTLALAAGACDRSGPSEDELPITPAEPIDIEPQSPPPGGQTTTPAAAGTLALAPGAVVLRPSADDMLQWSAAVTEVHLMPNQGAKLFSTAGGDPAMNGLYTYLALHQGAAEGWRIFRIGDFESWRVIEEAPGRVLVEVRESAPDAESGEVVTATRRLNVAFDATAPDAVTVTPAD